MMETYLFQLPNSRETFITTAQSLEHAHSRIDATYPGIQPVFVQNIRYDAVIRLVTTDGIEPDAEKSLSGITMEVLPLADIDQHEGSVVKRYLDLATANLSSGACEWLDTQATRRRRDNGEPLDATVFEKGEEGYFVWVPTDLMDAAEMEDAGIPWDLLQAFHRAHALGCAWLQVDRDGEEDPNLPAFTWDWPLAVGQPIVLLWKLGREHGYEHPLPAGHRATIAKLPPDGDDKSPVIIRTQTDDGFVEQAIPQWIFGVLAAREEASAAPEVPTDG